MTLGIQLKNLSQRIKNKIKSNIKKITTRIVNKIAKIIKKEDITIKMIEKMKKREEKLLKISKTEVMKREGETAQNIEISNKKGIITTINGKEEINLTLEIIRDIQQKLMMLTIEIIINLAQLMINIIKIIEKTKIKEIRETIIDRIIDRIEITTEITETILQDIKEMITKIEIVLKTEINGIKEVMLLLNISKKGNKMQNNKHNHPNPKWPQDNKIIEEIIRVRVVTKPKINNKNLYMLSKINQQKHQNHKKLKLKKKLNPKKLLILKLLKKDKLLLKRTN